MPRREFVALTSAGLVATPFPLTQLNQMGQIVSGAIDNVYYLTCHRPARHVYSFRHLKGFSESLKQVIEEFYPDGACPNLRAVLSHVAVDIDFDPGSNHLNLVYSAASNSANWTAVPADNIGSAVYIPPKAMASLVFDLLLDMAFANSEAILPIIRRYLVNGNYKSLFALKHKFIHARGLPISPVYGPISQQACYVSFAAATRQNHVLSDPDHLVRVADAWDDFVNSALAAYRPSLATFPGAVAGIPQYGGQIVASRLLRAPPKSGSLVLVLPKLRRKMSKETARSLAGAFSIYAWHPRHSFMLDWSQVKSSDKIYGNLCECLRSNQALAFRLYIGDDNDRG